MKRLLLLPLLMLATVSFPAQADRWIERTPEGEVQVQLYFFWSEHCPHCAEARPIVEQLDADNPWLIVHSLQVDDSAANRQRYAELAALFGEEPRSVPAFFYCGEMEVGFGAGTPMQLQYDLNQCRLTALEAGALPGGERPENQRIDERLADIGGVDARDLSLPVLTVLIAALDAFNPCAFFVLLFLLSLLVHLKNRRRMLLVGGVFVFFSGLLYYLFMAAWLNLFLIMGQLRVITAVAGAVAVLLAGFNIKDYLYFGRGPSLSIPEKAKPGLFQRMRGLLSAERLPTLLVGTVVLAAAANSYELLCTSGLPLVYTRILTLEALPTGSYYLYLLLYNVVYVLPLLAIVAMFTWTLGSRKLQEREGRLLKLLSGLIMLGLGLVLLLAPTLLDSLLTSVALIAGALLLTFAIHRLDARRR